MGLFIMWKNSKDCNLIRYSYNNYTINITEFLLLGAFLMFNCFCTQNSFFEIDRESVCCPGKCIYQILFCLNQKSFIYDRFEQKPHKLDGNYKV